ncbi:caspase family protein [Caldisericum exile]|uniref:Peptidase C14 caspase domain-containing protein n=1 Tax=Caldisericum exile (strain DSM 21853 / NBRC 104410 / AZM16c01) TaxID=511051 RepID=A0A7U6JEJ8_CALEA|nr:caspase family protein [Caldisericum exile]BAL80796.1 hypothetical protein CSE_06700 [Caldisericum exile AZM16c01]
MKKLLAYFLLILFIFITTFPTLAISSNGGKQEFSATDIEIVKKLEVKGKPTSGKPATAVATGIIGEPCAGNKYAIVIGINDYPGTSNDLNFCVADALSMKEALTTKYGYETTNIYLITDSDANRTNITNAITSLRYTVQNNDEVFFFFSGHGAKGKANDGDKENIDESIVIWGDNGNFDYLWDGELKDLFNGFKTNRIIFAFDSCLSGGMTDLASGGRIINMACSESGVSYEFSDLGHGQFTYYFVVQGMLNGLADTNKADGSVTVEEAFDYTASNCIYQKPTISDQFTNDLLP